MIDEKNIVELRKNWLEIMDVIDVICMKNNIQYSLVGGTMLGAVRHGGFIPWDDDFDIGMLRKDFQRFIEVSKNELGEEYFLQTSHSDSEYSQNFAKVRKNNTLFVETSTKKLNINHGIFIDVFPYDNVPNSKFKRLAHAKAILFFKRLANAKNNQYNFDKTRPIRLFGFIFLKLISYFISIKHIVRSQNTVSQFFSSLDTEYVSNMGGGYTYSKQTIPKNIFKQLKKISFEDRKYSSFSSPEVYLKKLFGDYMKLPPKKDQDFVRHNVINVSFDTKK